MRNYEAVVIFSSEEAQLREGREFVKKEFEASGITVTKEEDRGDNLLAYPIRKNDRGHYFLYIIQSTPEPLKNLNRSFKLRPEILQFLLTRQGA